MNPNKFQLCILTFLILAVFQALPSEGNAIPEIELVNGMLSINNMDITIGTVFDKLHKETGIEFVVSKDYNETRVTTEIQTVPLRDALMRILSKLSYAIIENDANIKRVIVLGRNLSPTTIVNDIPINTSNSDTTSSDGMRIKLSSSSNETPEGMMSNMPSTKGIPEGMKISTSPVDTIPDGMQSKAIPSNMEIKPSSSNEIPEGMKIGPASIEGMKISPSSAEGMNIGAPN